MLKKMLPIVLALIGTGAGVGAGLFLMPANGDAPDVADHGDGHAVVTSDDPHAAADTHKSDPHGGEGNEYVKLNNQFVIPIMGAKRVEALVVAALSLEVSGGTSQTVYAREPKLRDVFLQVMFDHANIGGFEGPFTSGDRMEILRSALLDAARSVLGSDVQDVLITEIARQDAA
ncbi:flagellar basal body-associated FliL family protein [Antarctobacter heliothermus]|uniref:Flagellar protein FliL n=1 Tax=Antarctobacter heliothermus TaxID=74033 RepID=A0A239BTS6_9RHOB|nr:flagellar basal body-associated FliL family protein [Antarctobacter heliothermus]SNS11052.1 Flagellar basal body-associated protein FliL [Antarctobacter heliothermus]